MHLEIVTHCWNYGRLLTYQLSSFVLNPPKNLTLTVTVFYNEEDRRTCNTLDFFSRQNTPNVCWNWRNLDRGQLCRRAIGRNLAAVETTADWIWFTDCDQVFGEGCLDALPEQLEHCKADLVFPRYVALSKHIGPTNPLFADLNGQPKLLEIDPDAFSPLLHTKAIGALQIVRGDVVRKSGYCREIPKYMKPLPRFQRTPEDVAFRRTLGTNGTPIDLPRLYRIEHRAKGRRRLQKAHL